MTVHEPSGIIYGEPTFYGSTPGAAPFPKEPGPSSWLTTTDDRGERVPGYWEAAFGLENTVVAVADMITRPRYEPEPHDPLSVIKDTHYETHYLDEFATSVSEADTRARMARIDTEEKQRDTIARGGGMAVLASMVAGTADPTILLPVAGWLGAGARLTKGARVALGAVEGAAVVGGSVAVQEGILQTAQATRTPEESAAAIAMGTFLGAALGTAASALTRAQLDDIAGRIADEGLTPITREQEIAAVNSAVGAQSSDAGRGSGKLAPTVLDKPGVRVVQQQDPMWRTAASDEPVVRNVGRDLYELPQTLAENADGIATSPGGSAETIAKQYTANLGRAVGDYDKAFFDYYRATTETGGARAFVGSVSARLRGNTRVGGAGLTYDEFRIAVARALREGDEARFDLPDAARTAVERAARSFRDNVFDPLKQQAIDLGIFGPDVKPGDDISYLMRVYNTEAIARRTREFVDTLTSHFMTNAGSDLAEAEVRAIAQEIANTIQGTSPKRLLRLDDFVAGERGPMRERMLKIPTHLIEDFVVNDPEMLARMYTRTMASDIGLIRKFGSIDMMEQVNKINDAYARRLDRVGDTQARKALARIDGKEFTGRDAVKELKRRGVSLGMSGDEAAAKVGRKELASELEKLRKAAEKESGKINKAKDGHIRDLLAMRDRLRGTAGIPDNPNALLTRASRTIRNLNYLRLLGGMTLSALPDLARPIMVQGIESVFGGPFQAFVKRSPIYKMAKKEAQLAGTAWDMILDTRAMAMADVFDDFGRGTTFERGLGVATRKMGIVSLMAPWNSAMKKFVGVVSQTKAFNIIERIKAGKATKKELSFLAAGGIDDTLARKIWAEFQRHGVSEDGVRWANTAAWTDTEAREAFRSFLVREIDRTIVSPGMDRPLLMDKEHWRMALQFKSFGIASMQRTLAAGLQQGDASFLLGAMLSVALGTMSYMAKMTAAGYTISTDPRKLLVEGLDRSGVFGWLGDANNILEKATRGRLGASAITGEVSSRYASRNLLGAFLGPTADVVGDVGTMTGAVASGDWKASDTHRFRKTFVPFQNLFYLRGLFDEAERGVNRALGVEEPEPRQ